ncbi:hypothetical protein KKI43_22430 [Arthrobacter sp. GN70]|nr:hypothetical protein [Arthrobacter sp. GN70]
MLKSWKLIVAAATVAIVLGVVAVVIVVSLFMHGATDTAPPNAAEWLSAISTFWGSVAAAIGAIGTAGALWLGAIAYNRQTKDQHRSQAATVTVHRGLKDALDGQHTVRIDLANQLPIFNVELICFDPDRGVLETFVKHVVTSQGLVHPVDDALPLHEVSVTFTDSSGIRWTRWSKGKLIEVGPEPEDFDIVETPVPSHEERNKLLQKRMARRAADG